MTISDRRRHAAALSVAVGLARKEIRKSGWLTEATCGDLRILVAHCELDALYAGEQSRPLRATRAAMRLIAQCDPCHEAREANIEEIDRLTAICDEIMDRGLLPAPVYLCGLAEAVLQYEDLYSCGADPHITCTAWDVIAQAEAGLGEPVEPEHYEQAHARHSQNCCAADNVTRFPKEPRRAELSRTESNAVNENAALVGE